MATSKPVKPATKKPVRAAVASRVTHLDIREALVSVKEEIISTRNEILGLRGDFVVLQQHVNDELEAMTARIEQKADEGDLLKLLGVKMLNHRIIRWVAVSAATALLALVVQSQFGGSIVGIAEAVLHLAESI